MTSAGWKIALAASLAVNVFVVGIGVGALGQRHRAMELRHARMPDGPLMRMGERLPPEKRDAFRAHIRQAALANRSQLEAGRAARQTVVDVFSQPTFSANDAVGALAAVRSADMAGRANIEEAVVGFVRDNNLSVDERKTLAQDLNRPPGRGRGGRRPGMHGGPPGFGPGPGPDGPPR